MKRIQALRVICTIIIVGFLLGKSYGQHAEGFKHKIGDKIPNLQLTDYKSNKFKLQDLNGKVVIINLFATWCKPCMREMKFLSEHVSSKYDKSKVEVLAVGYEHIPLEIEYFIEDHEYNFTYIPDFYKKTCTSLAESGVPRCIVIDKNGIIVEQKSGFNQEVFEEMLPRLKSLIE